MTKSAYSTLRTTRRPPACCWRRICWATFARRHYALSPRPRWRRSWPSCPDDVEADSGISSPNRAKIPGVRMVRGLASTLLSKSKLRRHSIVIGYCLARSRTNVRCRSGRYSSRSGRRWSRTGCSRGTGLRAVSATTVPIILPESLRYAQSVLDHPVE